jgi:hypothetical protein
LKAEETSAGQVNKTLDLTPRKFQTFSKINLDASRFACKSQTSITSGAPKTYTIQKVMEEKRKLKPVTSKSIASSQYTSNQSYN